MVPNFAKPSMLNTFGSRFGLWYGDPIQKKRLAFDLMTKFTARSCALRRNVILLVLLSITSFALAQGKGDEFSYGNPQRFVIKDINVTGVQYADPAVLLDMIGLAKGDTIELPGAKVTAAIKKLWQQNLFSGVDIRVGHVENEFVTLEVVLTEQPRISSIEFQGAKRTARDDLKEKLNLRIGQQAAPSTLDAAKRMIMKYYLDKGYRNAQVEVRQQPDTAFKNASKVFFVINRGKKVKVKSIDFEGNTAFTDGKLRWKGFKSTKRLSWNIFRSAKFIEDKYRADLGNLITYYNRYGYRDARVTMDTVYTVAPNRLGIRVQIDEGPKYYIRDIKWVGNTVYPAETLTSVLGMKKGDVYDQSLLEKRLFTDENSILTGYQDNGYLFFSLTPVETNVENDSVTLEMRLFEGPQATINNVAIFGNTRTNENVIRRELRSYPGELFSRTNIIRSVRELANLGYFNPEALDVRPVPNAANGTVDINYTVEEKSSDQLELSAGWGGGMFVGTIGVRFGNFSIRQLFNRKAWRPVPSGDGQSLAIRGTTNGQQYRAVNVSFTEPWLGGRRPTNLTLSFFHSVTDYSKYIWRPSSDYFKVTGGSIGVGTRLKWPDDYFTIYSALSFQNYSLRNWRSEFLFTDGEANNFSLQLTWARNSVDQLIYPRSGSNFSITLQATPPYSYFNGKDYESPSMTPQERYHWVEYHKWTSRAQWYTSLWKDLVLYLNAQFGYLGYYNHKVGYSPFEGFTLGGDGLTGYNYIYGREAIGLRGYANGSLTPVQPGGVQIANVYNKFTLELRYPIILKPQSSIYMLVFAEAGNSWYEFNRYNPFDMRRSVGAGFRVFLQIVGMLGFDIGYGFDEIRNQPNANKWQPHFIIGFPF